MDKDMNDQPNFAVIGAGAWGAALAAHISRKHKIVLWSRRGELPSSLSNYAAQITPTKNMPDVAHCNIVILATPAQTLRTVLTDLKSVLREDAILVCCAKGIEQSSGLLLSEIAQSIVENPFLVLSGPSFADEVTAGLPAALTIAGKDNNAVDRVVDAMAAPNFRLYKSDDVTGVQLGGAVKNVVAIACGMAIGAGLGENARAALITRALAEIMRLAHAIGGRKETLMGLSGLGDLALTCASVKSRNFSYGFDLGKGSNAKDAALQQSGVVEGALTAPAVLKMAEKYNVELPICSAVNSIIQGTATMRDAMNALLLRPLKAE